MSCWQGERSRWPGGLVLTLESPRGNQVSGLATPQEGRQGLHPPGRLLLGSHFSPRERQGCPPGRQPRGHCHPPKHSPAGPAPFPETRQSGSHRGVLEAILDSASPVRSQVLTGMGTAMDRAFLRGGLGGGWMIPRHTGYGSLWMGFCTFVHVCVCEGSLS